MRKGKGEGGNGNRVNGEEKDGRINGKKRKKKIERS